MGCGPLNGSRLPGANAKVMGDPHWPGNVPLAAQTCHSRFRHVLYGIASPYRLKMFRLARTHIWLCRPYPPRSSQKPSMVSSKPSKAQVGWVKCGSTEVFVGPPPLNHPSWPSLPVYQLRASHVHPHHASSKNWNPSSHQHGSMPGRRVLQPAGDHSW